MWAIQARLSGMIGMGMVFLALSGCLSLSREVRPIHTFLLSGDNSTWGTPAAVGKPGVGILVVNLPVAQPGFDTPRMAYQQRPYEVSYYATHQWAEQPARMLTPLLVHALERTGHWRAIVPMPTSVRGDHRVDIDQLVLVQDFLQKPSQVRFALRAQVIKMFEHQVLGTRLFEVIEDATSDDAYGGAVAANRAVARLLKELAGWLSDCVSGGQSAGCSR